MGTIIVPALANGETANRLSVLSPRTFGGTWTWTGSNFANYTTVTSDQEVVLFVSGLNSDYKNAAATLRYSSASDLLRAKVSGSEFALEDGSSVLKTVARSDSATQGSLDVLVIGNAVSMKWNGSEVLTYSLTKSYGGKACGMQVWQDVASAVTVAGVCGNANSGVAAASTTTTALVTSTTAKPSVTSTSLATTTTTRIPATTTTTAASSSDRSPGWLSGMGGDNPDAFGAWRGSPVEIAGTWLNDPGLFTLTGSGTLANYKGAIDVGVAPPTWSGWQAEANGAHDDFYRQMFTNLKNTRAGTGTVYVRPWYEFNGNWMDYSVAPGQEALFKQAWIRVAGIARTAFPDVKLVLCASAATGADIAAAWPGKQYVDVGGIDFYNNWPFVTTQAGFDSKIATGGGKWSMEPLRQFYQSQGVPVAINEWSNQGKAQAASTGGGGESPQFIDSMYNYIRSHAGSGPGQITYEVQFNLWPDQFQFYPSNQTVQPQTAAEYARMF